MKHSDEQDAAAVVAVVRALAPFMGERPAATLRVVRRALEEFWDAPRATKQGHRKRDGEALWTREALREAEAALREGRTPALVGEHAVPVKIQVAELVARTTAGAPLEALLEVLPGRVAVVTKEQDKLFTVLGLRQAMPEGWQWGGDPWARYRAVHTEFPAAGLDPGTLERWPREVSEVLVPAEEDS